MVAANSAVSAAASAFGCIFSQREVSKDKPQLPSELLLKRFDDRVCTSTVRTLVVAIFDQSNRGVRAALFSGSFPRSSVCASISSGFCRCCSNKTSGPLPPVDTARGKRKHYRGFHATGS